MQLFPVCRTKNRDRRRITEYMLRRDTERQKAQTRKRVSEKCKSYPCVRAFPPRGPSENARWNPPGIHKRTLCGYYSICHHYLPLLRGSPYERPFVRRCLKQPQKIPHAVKRRRRNRCAKKFMKCLTVRA